MKLFYGILFFLCIGSANAGIAGVVDGISGKQLQLWVEDVVAFAGELSELKSIDASIDALPADTPISPELTLQRRNVVQRLELREYQADEADRRLIKFLTAQLAENPNHPSAADWMIKIADAKKHLLREPSSLRTVTRAGS